jgi:hypothetical protein
MLELCPDEIVCRDEASGAMELKWDFRKAKGNLGYLWISEFHVL